VDKTITYNGQKENCLHNAGCQKKIGLV